MWRPDNDSSDWDTAVRINLLYSNGQLTTVTPTISFTLTDPDPASTFYKDSCSICSSQINSHYYKDCTGACYGDPDPCMTMD